MAEPTPLRRLAWPVALLLGTLLVMHVGPVLAPALLDAAAPAGQVLRALVWVAGTLVAVRLLDALFWHGLVVRRSGHPPPRLLVDLVGALVWIVTACIIAAAVFRWPVAGIVTTSGVAVAVLGFALRDMLASLFAGVALNVERPYQIGDWIEVEPGPAARVVEVGWLTTRAVTRDGIGVILPNAYLVTKAFRNYSQPEPQFREILTVTLDYDAAPQRVEQLLLAAAAEVREIGPLVPTPDVKIAEFGPRGIVWQLRFWLDDYGRLPDVRYQLQRAVLRHLHQAGLSLPYAKLDIFQAEMPPRSLEPGRADEALLARCEIFHPLEAADLAILARAARHRRLPTGSVLLRMGDLGDSLFLVLEGVLEVWHEHPDGSRQRVHTVGAGGEVGEFSLLTGERRSATVTVKRDALLLEIGREALAPVLERRPALAEALGRILARRQERSAAASLPAALSRNAPSSDERGLGQRIRAFFGL
jgi:small-conductance mechanosensitive channel/CRP-like cAMP-binding protein